MFQQLGGTDIHADICRMIPQLMKLMARSCREACSDPIYMQQQMDKQIKNTRTSRLGK